MPSTAIDVLRAVFPRLSSESITALYEQARLTEYPDKTILVREGEPGDTLYVIVNGQVEVSKLIDGARHVLDTLGSASTRLARLLKAEQDFSQESDDIGALLNQALGEVIETLKKEG